MKYQYHITINPIIGTQINSFQLYCVKLGGKAIIIELSKGDTIEQPMFSITLDRDFDVDHAIKDAEHFAQSLRMNKYLVSRIKIEISANDYQSVDVGSFEAYFEWHCLIQYNPSSVLNEICKNNKLHISKNAIIPNTRYLTLRCWDSYDDFLTKIEIARDELKLINTLTIKEKNEYCVYDSNCVIDKGWVD